MMFRLLSLLTLMTCLSEAQAEWFVDTIDGTTFATIGRIEMGDDEDIPDADIYVVSSPGGYMHVAVSIAEQLKDESVTYLAAMSAGALIVDLTGAPPMSPKAVKGYHWSIPAPGNKVDPASLALQSDRVDKFMMSCIFNSYKAKYAARIIGLLSDLPDGWMVVDIADGAAPKRMSPAEILSNPIVAAMADKYEWNK